MFIKQNFYVFKGAKLLTNTHVLHSTVNNIDLEMQAYTSVKKTYKKYM